MSEEQKSDIGQENTGTVRTDSDVIEGLFDYNSIYGIEAEEKRKKQSDELMREIRREAELKAIKEDIERRYSLELEAAQSKANDYDLPQAEPQAVIVDTAVWAVSTSKAETELADKPVKKRKELKSQKRNNTHGAAYEAISDFGADILTYAALIIGSVLRVILVPIKAFYGYSEKATGFAARRAKRYAVSFLAEAVHFRKEIHSASSNIRRAFRHPAAIPSILAYYFKKAFKRHHGLIRTVVNVSLPIAAIMIFAITINYWNGVTFALKVTYNEHEIGYISNEAVYIRAQELVKEKMDTGAFGSDSTKVGEERTTAVVSAASAQPNLQAKYSLSLVSLEELNDAQTICDRIIENSVDNLTNACGVYIDGEFVCAVKNEADAKTVFDKIIAPYEAKAADDNGVVSFVQDIEYVQGLYPDNDSVMWDAAHLEQTLSSTTQRKREYTVGRNDSLESIAEEYDLTQEQLVSLNPDYDWDSIKRGDKVTVTVTEDLVTVKKTVTTTTTESVKFSTQKKRDATKYSGYRKVQQKGQDGVNKVITTTVYIDGEVADVIVDRERIVEPVDEIVIVGSNKYYGNVYVGEQSAKGFLWPAPSCHRISSPYGNRSSGWHKGVDLIKSGGGANGTPVIASRSGTIEVVSYGGSSYGNMILINHGDGYKTRYAHLLSGSIRVSTGDYVEAGKRIASVGSTGNSSGPHLHFEVIYNGSTRNPMNYIG